MNDPMFTIAYPSKRGTCYLCCIETHCYGDRILGYFDLARSTAMPMSQEQAKTVLAMLRESLPPKDLNLPHVSLQIVPVPWDQPEEGSGND